MNNGKELYGPTIERIQRFELALSDRDMTVIQLCRELNTEKNLAHRVIARMRKLQKVHVCGHGAQKAAIYRLGPGVDAIRPEPTLNAIEKNIRERERAERLCELPIKRKFTGELPKRDPLALPLEFFMTHAERQLADYIGQS